MLLSSRAQQVLSIQELFEEIMQHVSMEDLFRLQSVNHLFNQSISGSTLLRRLMFLEPSTVGPVLAIRCKKYISPRIPRRLETIWSRLPAIDPSLLKSFSNGDQSDRLPNHVLLQLCENLEVERPVLNPMLEYWCINRKLDTINLKHSPVSHAEVGLRLVPRSCKSMAKNDSRRQMLITQPPVADVVIGRSDTQWGIFETHNPNGVTIGDILDEEEKMSVDRVVSGPPLLTPGGWRLIRDDAIRI